MTMTPDDLLAIERDYTESTRPIRASFVAAIYDEQQTRGVFRSRVLAAVPRLIDEVRTLSAQCADLRAEVQASRDEVG
jgi:hypothetical protein